MRATTTRPLCVERNVDTLNWFIKELAADAPVVRAALGVAEPDGATVTPTKWAQSKHAFIAHHYKDEEAETRPSVKYMTVRRGVREEFEAEVYAQLARAETWVTTGVLTPNTPIKRPKRRRRARRRGPPPPRPAPQKGVHLSANHREKGNGRIKTQ